MKSFLFHAKTAKDGAKCAMAIPVLTLCALSIFIFSHFCVNSKMAFCICIVAKRNYMNLLFWY